MAQPAGAASGAAECSSQLNSLKAAIELPGGEDGKLMAKVLVVHCCSAVPCRIATGGSVIAGTDSWQV